MQEAELIAELRRLPLRPSSVTRVLMVLDDPRNGAAAAADAVSPDVGLCARILHLANSPYFGASGRIGSIDRAVVTVGTSVVRSLAITTAAGLLGEAAKVPAGFWSHSGAVGVAASRLAGRFGLAAADALCAGLLHDLGVALAYQFDSEAYAQITESAPVDLLAAEALRFGADHAHLGGIALAAWRLPSTIVDGVASHHCDVAGSLTLTHAVIAGEALVQIALPDAGAFGYDPAADPEAVLFELGIAAPEVHELASRVSDDAEQISAMLVAA